MVGVFRSLVKMKMLGVEVVWVMRLVVVWGEVVDLERVRKGCLGEVVLVKVNLGFFCKVRYLF